MIVDCHCHAGVGDGLTGPWDTSADLTRYLRRARRAGIDRSILFAVFDGDYDRANRAVARIVATDPARLWGFVFVHADRDRGRIGRMVAEGVEKLGFKGVKVHRYDARITREVCEAARAYSLPVLYDVMGEVSAARILAEEYPDVRFVIPHLGSFGDDWRAQTAFIPHLATYPNLYTDTSGIRRFDLLVEAVAAAGPHKVCFGSDGPWLHPGLELHKVRLLGLPADAEARILGGNILELVERAGARPLPAPPARPPKRPPSAARATPGQAEIVDPWTTTDSPE